MGEFGEAVEEVGDGFDGDVLAVGEVDSFEGGGGPFDEGVEGRVGEGGDADEADAPEFGEEGELEDGHVGEEGTA